MSGSRSNTEAQEEESLGTGGLERARQGLSGRNRKMMDAEEEATYGPKPKKKAQKEETED